MVSLQRIAWRTDSCAECKGPNGEDLSGGYYEAGGSYLKFSFPTAFTLTQLAWGVVQYRDGYAKVQHPWQPDPQLVDSWIGPADCIVAAGPTFISAM